MLGAAGAYVPFLALHLEREGVPAATLGATLTAMALVRVVAGPAWGALADWARRDGLLLALNALACALLGAVVVLSPGVGVVLVVLVAQSLTRVPLPALTDAITVRALEARGDPPSTYGRIRLWGSPAYLIVATIGGGLAARAGTGAALAMACGAWLALALAAGALPRGKPVVRAPMLDALRSLRSARPVHALWVAAALHGVALNAYDALYPVHLKQLGLSAWWTGPGLAAGIGAEVVLMAYASRVLGAVGPWRLVALGMAVGAVRWLAMAFVGDPVLLTGLQVLHGLAFGGFWVGAVEALRSAVPDTLRASAQAVLLACCYGVGPALNGVLTGALLDGPGTAGIFAVGALCSALGAAVVWFGGALASEALGGVAEAGDGGRR